jgi:hypothetical protein
MQLPAGYGQSQRASFGVHSCVNLACATAS